RLHIQAAAYTFAGVCFAACLAVAYILSVRPQILSVHSVAPFLAVFCWPAVLTLSIIYPPSTRLRIAAICGYCVLLILGISLPDYTNSSARWSVLSYAVAVNLPFTVLALVFLHRRIRAVGPMVFVLLLICLLGAEIAIMSAGSSDRVL